MGADIDDDDVDELPSTVGLRGPVSLVDICFAFLTNHASHCRVLYIIYHL